jgi:molybdopterin-binding protein
MKAGVRNNFEGEVVEIKEGSVMAQVKVAAGDYIITSVMTKESLQEMDLKLGDRVTALTKAIHVTLVK